MVLTDNPLTSPELFAEVKQMEKGGGKGSWSAWKAGEMAKVYEAKGGSYEDTGKNPNSSEKGAPKPKKEAVESGERKAKDAPVGEKKAPAKKASKDDGGEKKKKSSAQKPKKEPTKGSRTQPTRTKKK
ncbi:hypothetical protein CBS101457_001584 [Exobasidium rhododendri]|nr:hypothetical protein CBS101457_001584 [Exobasidium rhododendri]